MNLIKRTVFLKGGEVNDVKIKIPLYQNIKNMGLLSDIPDNLTINPTKSILPLEFKKDGVVSDWYKQGGKVVYASDSKLNTVLNYNKNDKYRVDFDVKREIYENFEGVNITGVDRVTNINGDEITYVLNTKRDSMMGTVGQTTGILYVDNSGDNLSLPSQLDNDITKTKIQYNSEGWNNTNTSHTPQIQEEYLLGVISEPEVKTDVFIDRSTFSVLDNLLRLSEVESLEHLTRYGNGFYNINRD